MFGMTELPFAVFPGNNHHQGDQIRGFGFLHDGSFDTIFRFLSVVGFATPFGGGFLPPPGDIDTRQAIEAFMLAFDSNLAPVVGQQVTRSAHNASSADARIDLLIARADVGECDLIAKSEFLGRELGFLYKGGGQFITNRASLPPIRDSLMRNVLVRLGAALTYTCAPPGSGHRLGVDRDGDGYFDGDETDKGSDPADPTSTP